MWYKAGCKKEKLDYSKPIVAEFGEVKHILLPQLGGYRYEIKGYNWFDINKGKYTSCMHWKTPEEAVAGRSDGYYVHNVLINLSEI